MASKVAISVAIVGLGAVGRALAMALAKTGAVRLALIGNGQPGERKFAGRQITETRAQRAGRYSTRLDSLSDDVDIIILAVEDRNIGKVARELARLPRDWKRVRVLHTSGAQGSTVLAPLTAAGAGVAAWHPYQTFPARAQNVPLAGITFGISGNRRGIAAATRLTRLLGGKPLHIRDEDRALYHLSAVLACGFVAADLEAAVAVLRKLGISEKRALETVLPIAASTLEHIRALGIEAAQTGPAVRGDTATIRKHLAALKKALPAAAAHYRAGSEYILKRKR